MFKNSAKAATNIYCLFYSNPERNRGLFTKHDLKPEGMDTKLLARGVPKMLLDTRKSFVCELPHAALCPLLPYPQVISLIVPQGIKNPVTARI